VNVSIGVGETANYLTLPLTAVTYNPYGETVYVIGHPDAKPADDAASDKSQPPAPSDPDALIAKQVFVTVGPKRGDQVAILKGINAGDEVVTSGQIKLHNGTQVLIDNSVLPANSPNPTPHEQ
jgi:membrane fusion protein (multidrug efflux system)